MDALHAENVEVVPTNAMSFEDFYKSKGISDGSMYGLTGALENFFGGTKDKTTKAYEAYLTNLTNENEYKATQSARVWDKYMADTQYQRAVEDLKKAGLNPWLAVQNSLGASSVPSSSKSSYKRADIKESKNSPGMSSGLAMLLLGLAKMVA